MAKPETQVNRVRRFCEKIIARADKVEDETGRAYTMASGWHARREMARSLLRILERQ